ncbi:MAG: hypothetical protein CBARDMAM_0721 [uncultured Caballeronia sp.]|nr:MAG: hypothetical protein CBARDMAM_0721 [uncultured Caballeronia sp.]
MQRIWHRALISTRWALSRVSARNWRKMFARCSRAVVDDPAAAQRLSSEFIQAFGTGNRSGDDWSRVSLSKVIASGRRREAGDDITVFKAMGMGVSDFALGIELYHRASARGMGQMIPQPQRNTPRLTR